MVDNLYAMERLGREKVEELLRQADERRLERTATEAAVHRTGRDSGMWLVHRSPSTPAPKRA